MFAKILITYRRSRRE